METDPGSAGIEFGDVTLIVATGYGRINVPFADRQITETPATQRDSPASFPSARTIVDIGGQDSKGIRDTKTAESSTSS